jgi:hypothetical protein
MLVALLVSLANFVGLEARYENKNKSLAYEVGPWLQWGCEGVPWQRTGEENEEQASKEERIGNSL